MENREANNNFLVERIFESIWESGPVFCARYTPRAMLPMNGRFDAKIGARR